MRFKWLKIVKGRQVLMNQWITVFILQNILLELFPSTLKDLSALSQKYKIELQDYIGDLTFRETPINDAILFSE